MSLRNTTNLITLIPPQVEFAHPPIRQTAIKTTLQTVGQVQHRQIGNRLCMQMKLHRRKAFKRDSLIPVLVPEIKSPPAVSKVATCYYYEKGSALYIFDDVFHSTLIYVDIYKEVERRNYGKYCNDHLHIRCKVHFNSTVIV